MRSRRVRPLVAMLAGAVLVAAVPVLAADRPPTGWRIGLGGGGGTARTSGGGSSEQGTAGAFRVARVRASHLLLGIEVAGWTGDLDGGNATFSTTTFAATWYPTPSGWFLRGGLGTSHSGGHAVSSKTGFGLGLATGYELQLTRSIGLAPEVDYGFGAFDGFNADYANLTLNLNWTFGN